MRYAEFLARKTAAAEPAGFSPRVLSPSLAGFQSYLTRWALERGRAALWADCGLGKSFMALEWSREVAARCGRPVLIVAPLAVARQFVDEGEKWGVPVTLCRSGDEVAAGINVTNYDRLHRFDGVDCGGVVLDESSILKDYTSATRNDVIARFRGTPYRLCCTATPAPNDHMELGNHAEFLGVMTLKEMLAMYFVHDGGSTQNWRIKRHARRPFWEWVGTWAQTVRMPSDIGFPDDGYRLPPLRMHEHVVHPDTSDVAHALGRLFLGTATTLSDQRKIRRLTIDDRTSQCAELVNGSRDPWVVWCELNDESAALSRKIHDAVEVRGSDTIAAKEDALDGFRRGDIRVLVTKPSIAGWGVNWQHCASVAFVGLTHSFEQWYQAIRRTWRFGQARPVDCHLFVTDHDGAVKRNLERKRLMFEELMGAHRCA